MITDFTIWT